MHREVMRHCNKRGNKSNCRLFKLQMYFFFSSLSLSFFKCCNSCFGWQDKHSVHQKQLCISVFFMSLSNCERTGRPLQNSTGQANILFLRGTFLSPTTTCDSNWTSMVPETYWDLRICIGGRWIAEVHDQGMRGERKRRRRGQLRRERKYSRVEEKKGKGKWGKRRYLGQRDEKWGERTLMKTS